MIPAKVVVIGSYYGFDVYFDGNWVDCCESEPGWDRILFLLGIDHDYQFCDKGVTYKTLSEIPGYKPEL